jgi:hypothetical protein
MKKTSEECKSDVKRLSEFRNKYIVKINDLMARCDDISLLDLIHKLLEKHFNH